MTIKRDQRAWFSKMGMMDSYDIIIGEHIRGFTYDDLSTRLWMWAAQRGSVIVREWKGGKIRG